MRASRADLQEYVRWNDVVADVLFPVRDEPSPAYLDVEEHEIARSASGSTSTPRTS